MAMVMVAIPAVVVTMVVMMVVSIVVVVEGKIMATTHHDE